MKRGKEDGGVGLDESTLASAIGNGEDLGTIIRAAFEIGRPEALLGQLRGFVKKKEVEIEELCRMHYEEFIRAVDELRNVLVDAEVLKERLRGGNGELQDAGKALLAVLDELIRWHGIRSNLTHASKSVDACAAAVAAVAAVNTRVDAEELHPALKSLECVERDMLQRVPAKALREVLEQQLPAFRGYIEKKVSREFSDWLVEVRVAARQIGQLAIAHAASRRQREEELRARQRQAEEQSRWGSGDPAAVAATPYVLLDLEEDEEEDGREDGGVQQEEQQGGVWGRLDLTPVYRAHYIHACLGLGSQFRSYYLENRRLQLMSDLHVPPGPFLECHQAFLSQLAGFFIVEDRVLRTGGGLVGAPQVETLWESACSRVVAVLDEQLSRLAAANHMLLVKDGVGLLAATLRGYGYAVSPLLDSLGRARERYHELLLADCRRQVADVLANDKFEQMLLRKEYEYGMNVLAFGLQSSDVTPAFPYVAPFSSSVPDLCRLVRSFIEDSVAFLSSSGGGGGGGDYYYHDAVVRYCDRLVTGVVNEALLRLVRSPTLGMSQAMQLAANLTVVERACDFWATHAARLCGLPPRLASPLEQSRSALRSSQAAAQERMLELVKSKVDEFMVLTAHIDWAPDEPPQHGNAYLNEVVIYLETLSPSAQAILPPDAYDKWIRGVLTHISDCIVATLAGDDVRRFNVNAAIGIDADLRVLESFAGAQLRSCLAESRQLINLLLSPQPELYLNPVIRDKSYSALDPNKLLLIAEKYRDLPDKLFRSSSAHSRPISKKKSFDTLVKRLREFGTL